MKAREKKEIIINLILDDLVYTKLVDGLIELGLEAEEYCIDIGDSVLKLMGVKEKKDEALFEYYLGLKDKAHLICLKEGNHRMRLLANEIYNALICQMKN